MDILTSTQRFTPKTASSLHSFMLAMLLHPDVQSRALAEINVVCGDSVPGFEHRPSLPYIEAICREVLRWQPIAPLGWPPCSGYLINLLILRKGLPHMTSRDDVYEGYLIPKGPCFIH
jgi:hypothetical protein